LELEFAQSERAGRPMAILMLDSDHLKHINDKYGHMAGDDFLVFIADVIRSNIRIGDIACRYGGDEFVMVLGNVNEGTALERAEDIRKSICSHHIIHRNEKVSISVSIGIAMFPAHGSAWEELLQKADQALYSAKRMGKDQVLMYNRGQE
jgi:diguanylate cyclase (GGDEF)-like protein